MSEIPAEAVQAVLVHPWGGGPRSAHIDHDYDAECAVCRGDVKAVLTVAAPLLAVPRRATRPRIVCPVCSRDVVRRDDGKPTVHYPTDSDPEFTCDGRMFSRCRGGCACKKHR